MTYLIVIVLIIFSALFSGLTLGLMSLNTHELKRKMALGEKDAACVYAVRKNGNLLLTTLLIGNVAVNTVLSIFLGTIAPGVIAAIAATALIVIFGEITPQALFSRYALALGATFAPLVRVFIVVLYPVAKPVAMALDAVLGEELPTIYSKKELMHIIEEHKWAKESDVDADEERIIKGALTFSNTKVGDVMTPRSDVAMVEFSELVTEGFIQKLYQTGHSRFPVYREEQNAIVGILRVKELLGNGAIGKPVGAIASHTPCFVEESDTLDTLLGRFIRSHQHLFVVQNEFRDVVGVVTLEDIIEEIMREEIIDETDITEE